MGAEMIRNGLIGDDFFWFNEPGFSVAGGRLSVKTSPDTDFWQRTHYGFIHDNGHCLLTHVAGDFSLTVRTEFFPQAQYDQCGLVIRIDSENWIKTSIEYEDAEHARLGSVVTNSGYSDWATIDISSAVQKMWYRIQSRGGDFLIEYSVDGSSWKQLRIAHLHQQFESLDAGIYACSPKESSFTAIFDHFSLGKSNW